MLTNSLHYRSDSEVFCLIFTAFEYFTRLKLHLLATKESPEGEVAAGKESERVDAVIAMCVYLILSLKYDQLFNNLKLHSTGEGDIVALLVKYFSKAGQILEEQLLNYIFCKYTGKEALSPIIYSAFVSVIFGNKFELKRVNFLDDVLKRESKFVIIKRRTVLKYLMANVRSFTRPAVEMFLNDLRRLSSVKEVFNDVVQDHDDLINSFLTLHLQIGEEFTMEFYTTLLMSALFKPHMFITACVKLTGPPTLKLIIIDSFLGKCLANFASFDHSTYSGFLYLLQTIENSVTELPDLLDSELIVEVMSKFLIVADKMNVLYIALPELSLFDKGVHQQYLKIANTSGSIAPEETSLREGGFTRLFLKLILLLVRLDSSKELPSVALLQYYVFRKNEQREKVKVLGKVSAPDKANSQNYNLLDLALKNNKEKMNLHKDAVDAMNSVSIKVFNSIFRIKKVGALSKEKNLFENSGFLFLYLLGSILQVEYFECAGKDDYTDFATDEKKHKELIRQLSFADFEGNYSKLLALNSLYVEILSYGPTVNSFVAEFEKVAESVKSAFPIHYFPKDGVAPSTVYTSLGKYSKKNGILQSKQPMAFLTVQTKEALKERMEEMLLALAKIKAHIESAAHIAKKRASDLEALIKLVMLKLSAEAISFTLPWMQFFTSHQFFFLDEIVAVHRDSKQSVMMKSELSEVVEEKFGLLLIPHSRLEIEELKGDSEAIGKKKYKAICRDLESETGLWYDRKRHEENERVYGYVSGKYKKLLKHCPLYKYLEKEKKVSNEALHEFSKLLMERDPIDRAQKLVRIDFKDFMRSDKGFDLAWEIYYKFIRGFYLKKLLSLAFLSAPSKRGLYSRDYLAYDLQFPIFKYLFTKHKMKAEKPLEVPVEESPKSAPGSLLVYRDKQSFEVEMITIYGTTFGVLSVDNYALRFKSTKRKYDAKYKFGSTHYKRRDKATNKIWLLRDIREVVQKRYNLIRQGAEIYFDSAKSEFFLFFQVSYCKDFMRALSKLQKLHKLSMEIVAQNERYFAAKKFTEQWQRCEISSFEYLMLLNKYAGRSFNDLLQYPVFPWIITNYSNVFSYDNLSHLRQLKYPIGAISQPKRDRISSKFETLKTDGVPGLAPYQIGSHYLPGRAVLGYLLRLEPFASVLLHFEEGTDVTDRIFHNVGHQWLICTKDTLDNKELIPEFFYLPEMFGNLNRYSLGYKIIEEKFTGVPENAKVRVDEIVVPDWARNAHHFVQQNFLALESRNVSLKLNEWINLIFGSKQQDTEALNLFKESCDEESVKSRLDIIAEEDLVEMEEFGTNPMKLFAENHPARSKKELNQRTIYSIFSEENYTIEKVFSLSEIQNFRSSINYIKAADSRVFIVLASQNAHEIALKLSDKRVSPIAQHSLLSRLQQQISLEDGLNLPLDFQRVFLVSASGDTLITCRSYANSCELSKFAIQEQTPHYLYAHKSMVLCILGIHDTEWLVTGSQDGTVAVWDIRNSRSAMQFSACDHGEGVVTMDYNPDLDVLASASGDGSVALRVFSTWRFHLLVRLEEAKEYAINMVRLSPRGYVLVIARPRAKKDCGDLICVYSINGERVASRNAVGTINSVVMDNLGYVFITGDDEGLVHRYDLISLEAFNVLNFVEESPAFPLLRLFSSKRSVTALEVINDGTQGLLIGMNTGELLLLKYQKPNSEQR